MKNRGILEVSLLGGAMLAVVLALSSSAPMVGAAEEDNIPGDITVGNPGPVVENCAAPASVDPDVAFDITADVADGSGLAELDNIELRLWSGSVSEGSADAARNHYTFYWQENTDSWYEIGPDAGGAHINEGSCVAPDNTLTNDSITFNIVLAKVAEPTTWTAKVTAYDENTPTPSSDSDTDTFTVTQYIEIASLAGAATWSGVAPGSTDNPASTNPHSITVISNDTYSIQLKLHGDWTSGANTIGFDNTKFDNDSNVAGATVFSLSYQNIYPGLTWTASQASSMWFWVTIPAGTPPGSYTQNIGVNVTH